ncbi:TatD family hydrolase [Ferruginibacter yonginensis]|uniref:TatD family hydrolase n=1 Tax=Ferruginibacter yonginensis TaxID=1310416 RepID=A0ABV8QUX9_9BACT
MIDTHTHLYSEEFKTDQHEMIQRAIAAGVLKMMMPAIDSNYIAPMLQLQQQYPQHCFAMAGLHPCYVKENVADELLKVQTMLQQKNVVAIGETGLDFYWDTTFKAAQYQSLQQHIEWAINFKLPLILHTRNATQETIDVITAHKHPDLKGIFHCFGGSVEEAQQIIDLGFLLGIGGVLTYKNAGLDVVLKEIDMVHIVLETDAPYLAPVPKRGKRNESAYLPFVAQKLADIKEIDINDVINITTNNAEKLFKV